MIKAEFELLNEGVHENFFTKQFDTTKEMYSWYYKQLGHPFLSIDLIKYKEIMGS